MNEAGSRPDLFRRDVPHDVRQSLFGGNGAVRVWALVEAPALPFTAVLACELEAGASVGTHLQEQFSELVICVTGRGSVSVGGVPHAFDTGHVIELARGQTLAIRNDSTEYPLRYFIIKCMPPTPVL